MNLNQALTPHFTLEEFVRSGVAIRHNIANTPSTHVVNNLRLIRTVTRPFWCDTHNKWLPLSRA